MTVPSLPAACDFRIDLETGLARGAACLPSPHCDDRPAGMAIELLVIHAISLPAGEYGGPDVAALFCGTLDWRARADYAELAGLRVSAHFFIRRDGQIVQFVPVLSRAWHAGVSNWRGGSSCNDASVGVEFEGAEGERFAPVQYLRFAALTRSLQRALPIRNIAAHGDIAPGRKSDPGAGFEWERVFRALAERPATQ